MKKILIVDDSSQWITMHRTALKYNFGNGLKIDSATSAKEGYKCAVNEKSIPYDLILVDMEMEDDFYPLLAGEWLIKQLRAMGEYDNTKIFIISSVKNIVEISQKYGVGYLPKDRCKEIDIYNLFKN